MANNISVPVLKEKPPRPLTPIEQAQMRVRKLEVGVGDPEHVRDTLKMEEGIRARAYKDADGRPTVGIGFNLKRKSARDKFKKIGADYDSVRDKGRPLSEQQIQHLFDLSLADAYEDVRSTVPTFDSLAASRQAALVDMAFNMGKRKLGGFKRTLQAVAKADWERAAREILNSEYGRTHPERANRNSASMLMPMSEFTPPQRGRAK